MLNNKQDIIRQLNNWGFLPFFAGEIPGFSIQESINPDWWFPDDSDDYGVWDWKNDIIIYGDCAYGKFYRGKACFVSMQWFPLLLSWRRSRAKYQPNDDQKLILSTVVNRGSATSTELKKICGYSAPQKTRKGFDSAITNLQMGCRLLSAAYEYKVTQSGKRYGWSITRYAQPEDFFGEEALHTNLTPEECHEAMLEHLSRLLPEATEAQILRIID